MDIMPSQQKLGIILEKKISENCSYQKMSTLKVVHLNFYDSCHRKLKVQFWQILRTWHYFDSQNMTASYDVLHSYSLDRGSKIRGQKINKSHLCTIICGFTNMLNRISKT